jgi:hypothetical protein
VLKTTSVLQSKSCQLNRSSSCRRGSCEKSICCAPCARAWTCVVFTRMHPNHIMPFKMTVPSMAPTAIRGNSAAFFSPPGNSFSTDSLSTCMNAITMIMENTRIPIGSSRRRPTGNRLLKRLMRHCTNLLVVHTINVHSRSNAESTREAINDSEDE